MKATNRSVIFFLLSLALPGVAFSQVSAFDEEFVVSAASDNATEIALGRLARQQAQNPEVKDFARRMVQDHEQAAQQLSSIASSVDLVLPAGISAEHKQLQNKLAGEQGADFDREYMGAMVQEHQKTIALFERAAGQARSDELRAFAESTLPILREHLQQARQLAGRL